MKKRLNKNLIMSEEEELQSSNTCWICEKLKMTMKNLEIIVTYLENLETQLIEL